MPFMLLRRPDRAGNRVVSESSVAYSGTTCRRQSEALSHRASLPEQARIDSSHISTSAVHGMEYLLTRNCIHIANAVLRLRIEAVCRCFGYEPPIVRTRQSDVIDVGAIGPPGVRVIEVTPFAHWKNSTMQVRAKTRAGRTSPWFTGTSRRGRSSSSTTTPPS